MSDSDLSDSQKVICCILPMFLVILYILTAFLGIGGNFFIPQTLITIGTYLFVAVILYFILSMITDSDKKSALFCFIPLIGIFIIGAYISAFVPYTDPMSMLIYIIVIVVIIIAGFFKLSE